MEIIGAAASFIAIGQALTAGRHVFNLLKAIPEISKEYEALKTEIDILLDIIEEAKLAGNIADHVDLETPLFSRTLRQLKSLVDDLESLQKECTKDDKKEKKDKPKKAKWLFIQGQISQLQAKTSNARANLQTALQIMTWRMAQTHAKVLLHIERTTLLTAEQFISHQTATQQIPTRMLPVQASNSTRGYLAHPNKPKPLHLKMENVQKESLEANSRSTPPALTTGHGLLTEPLSYKDLSPRNHRCQCHRGFSNSRQNTGFSSNIIPSYQDGIHRPHWCPYHQSTVKKQRSHSGTLVYSFPKWLSPKVIVFQASMDLFSGISVSLRPLRQAHFTTLYYVSGSLPDKPEMEASLEMHGPAYPDDIIRGTNGQSSLLEVCLKEDRLNVLAFFMNIWHDSILRKACSRTTLLVVRRKLAEYTEMHDWEAHLLKKIAYLSEDVCVFDGCITDLHKAIATGDSTELDKVLRDQEWAVDHYDCFGDSPLVLAAKNGDAAIVEKLISKGADVNQRNLENETALMIASYGSNTPAVLALLGSSLRCDVNAVNDYGETALHCCAYSPDLESVNTMRALIQAGAKVSVLSGYDQTPAHVLCGSKHPRALLEQKLQLLVEKGAELSNPTWEKQLVDCAIFSNDIIAVDCIVDAGRRLGHSNMFDWGTLVVAAKRAFAPMLRSLERYHISGIDVHRTSAGLTPWDSFISCLHEKSWMIGSDRRPTKVDADAFVDLYIGIRNRSLMSEINTVESVLRYLYVHDTKNSREVLSSLVELKKKNRRVQQVETYRTVDLQIREKMWEAAIESVEENIELLKEDMDTSPWSYTADCCRLRMCPFSRGQEVYGTDYWKDDESEDGPDSWVTEDSEDSEDEGQEDGGDDEQSQSRIVGR